MPVLDGVAAARAITAAQPDVHVLIGLLDRFVLSVGPAPVADPRLGDLTPREHEVFALMGRGRTNTEIARELYLSETTVKTHVVDVLAKLGLRDRVQAVVRAFESGLIRPGTEMES
jgi:DNA-binding NarL/FixJ family response regulator